MDRSEYKNKHIKIGITAAVLFAVFSTVLNSGIISSKKKAINKMESSVKMLEERIRSYSNFESKMKTFELQKTEIGKVISEFNDNLVSRENVEKVFLETLDELTKKTGVKVDKLSQVGSSIKAQSGYEKQVWKVSFFATYNNLITFLNLLQNNEIFFGVEELDIRSGRNKETHRVNMNIYMILPSSIIPSSSKSSSYELVSSTQIFNLPFAAVKMLDAINMRVSAPALTYKLDKDPLVFGEDIFPKKVEKKEEAPVEKKVEKIAPVLELGGIIWDVANPQAIVDGKIVAVGTKIKGTVITHISENSVSYKWGSKVFKLKLDQ